MLIGISGAKRSGKTTLANALAARFGLAHLSFAAPIRDFTRQLLGWSEDELDRRKEDPIPWLDGTTARHMMQTLGTEWGRQQVHPEVWLRRAMRQVDDAGGRAVISDARFPNEAEAIIHRGGVVLRLTRHLDGGGDAHASETPLPAELVHVELGNFSTIASLVERAVEAVEYQLALRAGMPVTADED